MFSSLDLFSGYFQVPAAEQDKEYFAFSDGRRHFEFDQIPQGARYSGSTLSLLMELVLKGIPPKFLCIYLCAFSHPGTHQTLLNKMFTALKKAGLKVYPERCMSAQNRIRTLGFLLDEEGTHPDPLNLTKIEEWPISVNIKQFKQYEGTTCRPSHIPPGGGLHNHSGSYVPIGIRLK